MKEAEFAPKNSEGYSKYTKYICTYLRINLYEEHIQ
jgi:hypothetical protein